ncbi:hypothetical protein Cpap_0200 [Ruminiclostridium papyrosolvens DSM 2782]|uniref:Uncharacterized protein n=1 Tax=Ruminiclostridium papyrosolvens DSM 2782 TaxID=588581 RepID=F1TIL4_9FIRM|nr:hypothetical protein [Ruminiclostridium papyrosolvens]EGD45831.1 hypothetical protein Cpap_0200 [Ruminiclostridium papyrosolvens DSM 2782]WES33850.1 hypothetical protein P0092_19100 [Ruminiclostridium papyrosolvens DSM 2782]
MLSKLLLESIEEMESYNSLVALANDNKAKEQIEKKFNTLNFEFGNLLSEIEAVNANTDFVISSQVISDVKKFIEAVGKVIDIKAGNESINLELQKYKNSVDIQVKEAWNVYYSKKSSKLLSTLQTVMDITPSKEVTKQIINRIEKGKSWPTINKNIDYFISGLQDAEKIIEELNLDDEIMKFLVAVEDGNVTLADITDEVLLWINENNIARLFKVSFVQNDT